jgi:hypothetical protein
MRLLLDGPRLLLTAHCRVLMRSGSARDRSRDKERVLRANESHNEKTISKKKEKDR